MLGNPAAAREALLAAGRLAGTAANPMSQAKIGFLLSKAQAQLGDWAAALETCRSTRKTWPEDPELLYQEASLLIDAGRDREALRLLVALTRQGDREAGGHGQAAYFGVDPGLTTYKARHKIALVCARLGMRAQAERIWLNVTYRWPGFRSAWAALGEHCTARPAGPTPTIAPPRTHAGRPSST